MDNMTQSTVAAVAPILPSEQITSAAGVRLLQMREGGRLKAYQDERGIWTIGVGHTAAAGPPIPQEGMTLTETSMSLLFAADLKPYEEAVREGTKGATLHPNQFDACVSLCYNIGVYGFRGSSAALLIREARFQEAADHFLLWDNPPDLLPRRRAERLQFMTPYGG